MIDAANRALNDTSQLEMETVSTGKLYPSQTLVVLANGIQIDLEPGDAAFYQLFVDSYLSKNEFSIYRPKRSANQKLMIESSRKATLRYLELYRPVAFVGDYEKLEERIKTSNIWTERDFDSRMNAIKSAFEAKLGVEGSEPFIPQKQGNNKPYTLNLLPENITLSQK